MSRIKFLLPARGNAFFREVTEALRTEVEALGESANIIHDVALICPNDVVVMVAPQEAESLLGPDLFTRIPESTVRISLTADQPGTPWFESGVRLAGHFTHRFDFNRWAALLCGQLGWETEFLAFGLHAPWDMFSVSDPRPNSVAFLGEATERRLLLLAQAETAITRPRSRIVLSWNDRPNTVAQQHFLAGAERRALLARSALQLGIHRTATPYFEWLRMVDSAHTGAVFVTEPSIHTEPFVPNVDFAVIGSGGFTRAVRELLDNEDRRCEIALAARARLEESPLSMAAEKILERSLQRPRSMRRKASKTTSVAIQRRAAQELMRPAIVHPRRTNPVRPDHGIAPHSEPRRINSKLQGDLRAIRQVEEFWELTNPNPHVSIICPCRDGEDLIERALESAACTDEFVEVIFVDDGSRDNSLRVARQWARKTPFISIKLIQMRENVGLGRARNVALHFSRGKYFLPLDHDNEIFPESVRMLRTQLEEDPGASFSYGILIRRTQARNVGLLSFLPWDAIRLTDGNYIDALALIRRTAFDAVGGGYRADGQLRGWEDFDVWIRFAERGLYGSFLPSPIGYYTVRSNSLSAGLPHAQYFETLHEEYLGVFLRS